MKDLAVPPPPSLRQNRISFDPIPQEESSTAEGPKTLRIERIFPDRGMGWVDLSVLGERPALAQSLLIGVQYAVDACGSPSTMRSYHDTLSFFSRVMQKCEASGTAPIKQISDITVTVLRELSEVFYSSVGASTAYQRLSRLKYLLLNIEYINPGTYSVDVLQELCLITTMHRSCTEHKRPYTDHEFYQIERACRDDIRKTITRLTTKIEELRQHGRDPRAYGWAELENRVWLLENVSGGRFVSARELRSQSKRQCCETTESYRAIYPMLEDLIPFYLLLCIKTGLNPESVMRLKRNCLDDKKTVVHETLLHYVKLRSSGPMVLPVRTDGTFSPGGLIRTYLNLSSTCHEFSNDNSLWLVARKKRANFISSPAPVTFARAVCQFAKRHNLKHDDGSPMQLRADRIRTTRKTLNYRHSNGDLILAGHDHRRDSTTVEYINNHMTENVHNQAITNGQKQFHAFFSGAVVPEGNNAIEAAKIINTNLDSAEAILSGQQEMLIADCKDMFNAPGGEPGKLCEKVWACFGCPNSVWTSRILPKVIWYMDFFLEQRRLIAEPEWEKKFGYPYALITSHILPAFSAETIAIARTASKELNPYLPPEIRTF